jgi:hypothetical protein
MLYGIFNNNLYSIEINGIDHLEIGKNEIHLSDTAAIGISVANATGYKIEENDFEGLFKQNLFMIGLHISDSGEEENEVYLNIFNNLTVGQLFSGINADTANLARQGLQTLCNSFTNNYMFDILVSEYPSSTTYNHFIRKNQGSRFLAAGNLFYGSPTLRLNINNCNPNNYIDYYYGRGVNELPNYVSNVNTIQASGSNRCLSHYTPNPAKSIISNLVQYDEWNAKYEHWLTPLKVTDMDNEQYSEILDNVSYYSALKDNYFNWLIVAVSGERDAVSDEGNLYEDLRFLFKYRNHYTDNLSIVETYMAEGNYEKALITVADIYKQFELTEKQIRELEGLQTYIVWLQQLEENIYNLSDKNKEYLIHFVKTNIGRGCVFAHNILCKIYGICIEESGDKEAESRKQKAESEEKNLTVLPSSGLTVSENITLIPNPTTGELHVTCQTSLITSIEVSDVYGRKLLSHTANHTPHTALNISHLPAGFYFVKIKTDEGVEVKKVIKQ